MSLHWFPDNTVLCNFATVGALALLEQVLDGRGRWVEAIADEASRSARYLPGLARIERAGWLGDPIEIDDPAEIRQIDRIRRAVFGGTDDRPLQHLGEAQTCHVVLNWPEFAGSFWVTDDREAQDYARGQGITTRDTADLVSEAVAYGYVDRPAGYTLLLDMRTAGRNLRVPDHRDRL